MPTLLPDNLLFHHPLFMMQRQRLVSEPQPMSLPLQMQQPWMPMEQMRPQSYSSLPPLLRMAPQPMPPQVY